MKIPVKMEIRGAYHPIAKFFKNVSELRRIVNVEDLALDARAQATTEPRRGADADQGEVRRGDVPVLKGAATGRGSPAVGHRRSASGATTHAARNAGIAVAAIGPRPRPRQPRAPR